MIRYEFPSILERIFHKIATREFRKQEVFRYYLQFEIEELFGRSGVEGFRLKEMIKLQKVNEKLFASVQK